MTYAGLDRPFETSKVAQKAKIRVIIAPGP